MMEDPVARRMRRSFFHPKNLALMLASIVGFVVAVAAWPLAVIGGFAAAGAWLLSFVNDVTTPDKDIVRGDDRGGLSERERKQKLRELEQQLEEITKAAQARRLKLSPDFIQRRSQLRRMLDLEKQIAQQQSQQSDGTISTLPTDIRDEVAQFVERAIDLSFLRGTMLRAFVRTNETVLQQELNTIQGRYQRTTGPAKSDIELLLHAKEEQLDAFRRLRNDLVSTEAQLDAIEAFLNTITYGQSLTVGSVRQQMIRLKTKIEARRQSVEEVQRLVNGLER
jgi:hypothetical protein